MREDGRVVILNGQPRAGKSSIARALQSRADGIWMNIGADHHIAATPPAWRPGIGLRPMRTPPTDPVPGRVPTPELEDVLPRLFDALYGSVAAHARQGFDVVVDVHHHDHYSRPLDIFPGCLGSLAGLRVLFVGVGCPVEVIWERRRRTWGQERHQVDAATRDAVDLAQSVARQHRYDLEVDTSVMTPEQCAEAIVGALAR